MANKPPTLTEKIGPFGTMYMVFYESDTHGKVEMETNNERAAKLVYAHYLAQHELTTNKG